MIYTKIFMGATAPSFFSLVFTIALMYLFEPYPIMNWLFARPLLDHQRILMPFPPLVCKIDNVNAKGERAGGMHEYPLMTVFTFPTLGLVLSPLSARRTAEF